MKNKNLKTKALTMPMVNLKAGSLIESLVFLITITAAPAILANTPNNQWITGAIVNAILFYSCYRVGVVNTIFIAVVPSLIAAVRGLLPAPMFALIPFIMLGNITLIVAFALTKVKSRILRISVAAVLKFLVIGTSALAIGSLSSATIPSKMLEMMLWPQLITALAGGLAAVLFINLTQKSIKKNK
ncbi:MAG: hypothetical protein GF335_01060 [Candidatus Moranbacteria bacterium]|nr:hypothetical protein [Candidatus Moranbacteria bacterium]